MRWRISGSRALPLRLRERDDLRQLVPEQHLLAERRDAALEGERAHRHLPALARRADHVLARRARAVEEHLEELGVAGDLHDRPDLDAGLVHRHEQVREPLVPLRRGIGAADDEAPVRPRRPGGPHLLAVDHPLVALEARARLHVREVRARVRLRVALAPDLLAGDDRRQEAALLRLAAEGDQRRAEQRLADVVRGGPGAPARAYSSKKITCCGERRAAAAVLARPADAGPAARGELALPGAALVDEARARRPGRRGRGAPRTRRASASSSQAAASRRNASSASLKRISMGEAGH